MKRITSFFLACLVLFASVTYTERQAQAFLPVAVIGAIQVAAPGAASYSIAALAGLIGLTGLYLEITDSQGNAARIPLSASPDAVPPAPSAPAVAAPLTPAMPGVQPSDTQSCQWASDPTSTGGVITSCTQCVAEFGPLQDGRSCRVMTYSAPAQSYIPAGQSFTNASMAGTPATCSGGYLLSNGACGLDNPRQATPDKKCDMQFNGSKYLYYNDADCPSGPTVDNSKVVPGLRMDGKVVDVYGTYNGQPALIQVLRQTGTSGLSETVISVAMVQGPNVQTQTTTLSNTGQVTNSTTTLAPGDITAPVSSPTSLTGGGTGADTPTVRTDPTKPPVQTNESCGLPGKPACIIDDSGFSGKDGFITPKTAEIGTALDQNKDAFNMDRVPLPTIERSWLPSILPGNATECYKPVYVAQVSHGPLAGLYATGELDICNYLDVIRQILGYLLGVGTIFYIWRRFTRSNEGF